MKIILGIAISIMIFMGGIWYGSYITAQDMLYKLETINRQTAQIAQGSYELGLKLGFLTYHFTTNKANITRLMEVGWPNGATEYHRIVNDHQTNSKPAN